MIYFEFTNQQQLRWRKTAGSRNCVSVCNPTGRFIDVRHLTSVWRVLAWGTRITQNINYSIDTWIVLQHSYSCPTAVVRCTLAGLRAVSLSVSYRQTGDAMRELREPRHCVVNCALATLCVVLPPGALEFPCYYLWPWETFYAHLLASLTFWLSGYKCSTLIKMYDKLIFIHLFYQMPDSHFHPDNKLSLWKMWNFPDDVYWGVAPGVATRILTQAKYCYLPNDIEILGGARDRKVPTMSGDWRRMWRETGGALHLVTRIGRERGVFWDRKQYTDGTKVIVTSL